MTDRPRREYPKEQKAGAVQRVLEGGMTVGAVAREEGMPEKTLSGWLREHRVKNGLTSPEPSRTGRRNRVKELEEENRRLRQDVAALRAAVGVLSR